MSSNAPDQAPIRWVIFDEEDHLKPAPDFRLPALDGSTLGPGSFRGKNSLALFFAHSADCGDCQAALRAFASRSAEFVLHDTTLLAIFPATHETLEQVAYLRNLSFPVLADAGGQARRLYAGMLDDSLVDVRDNLLFVLDAYGAAYAALARRQMDSAQVQDEALQWVAYVSMLCPE